MLDDFLRNKLINRSPLYKDFAIEFIGYNFNAFCYTTKTYIKVPFVEKYITDKKTSLDGSEVELLSNTINNKFLSTFSSERYSLYDISFRSSNNGKGISLNFSDVKDSTYIDTETAFSPFSGLGVKSIVKETQRLKRRIFGYNKPNYNPVTMIGLLYTENDFSAIKSYVRFNADDFPTRVERINLIKRILDTKSYKRDLLLTIKKLENLGFVFSFVGIDSYTTGNERLKLYFRFYGNYSTNVFLDEISHVLSQNGLYSNTKDAVTDRVSGIWGLAISICNFVDIDGFQLYLFP